MGAGLLARDELGCLPAARVRVSGQTTIILIVVERFAAGTYDRF